jgi:hypothetical protein
MLLRSAYRRCHTMVGLYVTAKCIQAMSYHGGSVCYCEIHRGDVIPRWVCMLLRNAYSRQQPKWSMAVASLVRVILLMFRIRFLNSSLLLAINPYPANVENTRRVS